MYHFSMSNLRVCVNGADGKMGRECCDAINQDVALSLVASLDKIDNLEHELSLLDVHVLVDFTHPSVVFNNVKVALNYCSVLVGTTGLSDGQLNELDYLAKDKGKTVFVCPNFALGAVLSMTFAKKIANYFERAEIIEKHHDKKVDSPSGTAIKAAKMIAEGRGNPQKPLEGIEIFEGSRGGAIDGIPVHALRLPGVVADLEIIFSSIEETLSISHRTIGRKAFMPGVILSIKEIVKKDPGLLFGLESILDI